ncbi:phage protein NinX family protein [Morganella morganii]|uniref:phage protein NinX family protein n=1 Tax=Morganella morganii TaxID=582 RepID=UPI003BA2798B
MNKYSDKSDFEINKAVAVNVNGADAVVEKFGRIYIIDEDGIAMVSFDPCNNPADAFPLIIDVKLSIHPDFYNNCESWIVRTVHIPPVKDKSLTRAICIAYLMMKDAENEK